MRLHRLMAIIAVSLAVCAAQAQTTFTGRLLLSPGSWQHNKASGSSTLKETFAAFLDWTHTTGTNANQMQTIVVSSQTLTNSQAVTLDLDNMTNGFGDSVDFFAVRFMALSCPTGNVDTIVLGNAASNQFSTWLGGTNHTINIRPGGIALFVAPDLTAYGAHNTNGLLKITNNGTNNNTYSLYIGGSE